MKYHKIILGVSTIALLASCSSTQNSTSYHKILVPSGDPVAVSIPAKKSEMTEEEIHNWPHADIHTDSVPGMSLAQAYEFLADKKGSTVLVGIIDSGIDINHEDLKDQVWVNAKEIPNNGKDDDKNGYVDDINGWNFLGGAKGAATPEQLEVTRLYKKYSEKYKNVVESEVDAKDQKEYAYYKKVKKDFEKRLEEAKGNYDYYIKLEKALKDSHANAVQKLGKTDYTIEDLKTLPSEDQDPLLMRVISQGGNPTEIAAQLEDGIKYYGSQVNVMYNLDFDGRAVTGDDPYDINDVPYGNQYVIGSIEEELHGTHVAGITLATRNNGKGVDGVTNNVKLISVRTVPDGDEYDKDVALAIRYAVDAGAKVINMSFGKSYSPNPEWVYESIKYAASKDVLLVHAAGNDGKNIDKSDNFPTDAPDKLTEITDNYISIGAMTRKYDENLIASFSNYGKKNVDLFAPGLEIYSTVPKNEYEQLQGTSMAAPAVAGVAALIRSYYPELSASQVKHILMNSGTKVDFDVLVPKLKGEKAPFSDLSVSGRVLNAYNAVKMADAMVNSK